MKRKKHWSIKQPIKLRCNAYLNDDEEETVEDNDFSVDENNVTTRRNHIYFYSEVNRSSVLSLNKSLREIDEGLSINSKLLNIKNIPIYLHINSEGGEIFSSLSAVDYIRKTENPVYSIIEGSCASAGTFLSVAAKKRFITENSFCLIHQLSSLSWGNYEQLKDEFINVTKLMKVIRSIYLKYTKIPATRLDKILKHDLWFDANKCLKYGIVDEIIK